MAPIKKSFIVAVWWWWWWGGGNRCLFSERHETHKYALWTEFRILNLVEHKEKARLKVFWGRNRLAASSKCDSKPSGCTKFRECIDEPSDYQRPKMDSALWSEL